MENLNWQLFIEFAVAVAVVAVAIFLLPWLKEKLGAERAQQIEALIWQLVKAAEQIFGPGAGPQKKAYVVQQLKAKGIDAAAHDADIEAAVLEVNALVKTP